MTRSTCGTCDGEGYTDMGRSACATCLGAGVTTPEMLAALKELERWRGLAQAIRDIAGEDEGWPSHGNAPLAIAASFQLLKMDEEALTTPRPLSEYHEDHGFVTWWVLPVCEPAWIGSPNCSDWPGYHTHWTPHPPCPGDGK